MFSRTCLQFAIKTEVKFAHRFGLGIPRVHRCKQIRAFISSDVPNVKENTFTHIEEEAKAKILKAREKDLPIQSEDNPFEKERQVCILCKLNLTPNYKNIRLLTQFVSPYTGKIYGRHITGLCRKKQELVEKEILKAQQSGMMATMAKEVTFLKDPKLFDPEKPIRPHRF